MMPIRFPRPLVLLRLLVMDGGLFIMMDKGISYGSGCGSSYARATMAHFALKASCYHNINHVWYTCEAFLLQRREDRQKECYFKVSRGYQNGEGVLTPESRRKLGPFFEVE